MEHAADMMQVVISNYNQVFARLQFAGEIDVPTEAVIVSPPHRVLGMVVDELAVDVDPRLGKYAGELRVHVFLGLRGGQIDRGAIPDVPVECLANGGVESPGPACRDLC